MGNGCNLQSEGYATRWHVRKHIHTTDSQKDLHPFCSFICWIFLFQASAWLWPNVLYIFLIWRHKHFIWNFKGNITISLQGGRGRTQSLWQCMQTLYPHRKAKEMSFCTQQFCLFSPLPCPFPHRFRPQTPQPLTDPPLEAHSPAMAWDPFSPHAEHEEEAPVVQSSTRLVGVASNADGDSQAWPRLFI